MSIGSVIEANVDQFLALCPIKKPQENASIQSHIYFHAEQIEFLKNVTRIQETAKINLQELGKLNLKSEWIAEKILAIHESCKVNGEGKFTDDTFRVTVRKSPGVDKCGFCDHEEKELIYYELANLKLNVFFQYNGLNVHSVERHQNFYFPGAIVNNTSMYQLSVHRVCHVLGVDKLYEKTGYYTNISS